jgi:hypothetical protein
LNDLVFCSEEHSTTFLQSCPQECVIRNNPYWNAASSDFVKLITREKHFLTTIVLNGTRSTGVISNESTFMKHELPHFDSKHLKKVRILLLYSSNNKKHENCEKPITLHLLFEKLNEKQISYDCLDDPNLIIQTLCYGEENFQKCENYLKIFII